MGQAVGSEFKAQMDLGTTVSYNSKGLLVREMKK